MKALVVGGDGFIGNGLIQMLNAAGHDVIATTRRHDGRGRPWIAVDLYLPVTELPEHQVLFLAAGLPTFKHCENDPRSWRVNVDAQIELITYAVNKFFAHVVFISSDAVEWCGSTALARQKAHVEMFVLLKLGCVVRPAKVEPYRRDDFCRTVVRLGATAFRGVHRWA